MRNSLLFRGSECNRDFSPTDDVGIAQLARLYSTGMKSDQIANFLRDNVEPLKDDIYGNRYRAAARLIDDTYLPCVVFQSRRAKVELALRRFEQLRNEPKQYRSVVASFVSSGSDLAEYDIKAVELSPFAWPLEILQTIHGETTMGWTAFVAEMKDGTMHPYGTQFRFEFFDLPNEYSFADIEKIHSGMVYSQPKGLDTYSMASMKEIRPYREKPFFTCYLDEL